MGDTSTHKRNGLRISAGWLQFGGWLIVTLVVAGVAYGAFTAKHEAAVEQIKQIRDADATTGAKMEDVRERLVRVETRQEAQGVTLDRIDRTIQRMAKPK